VYERRGGPEASFAESVSWKGKRYSKLSTAFAFRQEAVAACTCRAPGAAPLSVTQDPTLQPGDIVVTGKGVRIFRGGKLPYQDQAFVDYRKDKELSKAHRAFLDHVDGSYHSAHTEAMRGKQADGVPGEKSSEKITEKQQSVPNGPAHNVDRSEALPTYAQRQE
jgi:hypothetical protein